MEKGRSPLPLSPGCTCLSSSWPCHPFFHPSDSPSLLPTLVPFLRLGSVSSDTWASSRGCPQWSLSAHLLPLAKLPSVLCQVTPHPVASCSSPGRPSPACPQCTHLPWAAPPVDILSVLEEPTEVPLSPYSLSRRPRALFPSRVISN